MSKLYVRSSLSAVGLLLAVALAAACADDPARSTMPIGRSHGLVTMPGDNPDPSDPGGSQYATVRCNVSRIDVTSLSGDGKKVKPDIIAGTTESYGALVQGALSSDGTACFPLTGIQDPNHMVVWTVGQWGEGVVAATARVTGVSNDLVYVKGLKVGRGTLTASVKDVVDGTTKTISAAYFLDVVGPTKVVVTPATFWVLQGGGTTQLTATSYDRFGQAIPGRTATWQSSSWSIAEVSATGLVTGRLPGAVTITGTVDGVSATSAATVRQSSCTDCTNPWEPSEPIQW